MARTRSLHFGSLDEGRDEHKTARTERSVALPPIEPDLALNPLLAMGNLLRDHKLIGEELRALHLDENAYHGNLQVILTALKRMHMFVAAMIEQCEGS